MTAKNIAKHVYMRTAVCLSRFAAFHNYRIPKSSLLNKTGDVTPQGKYITPYRVLACTCTHIYNLVFLAHIGVINVVVLYKYKHYNL